MAWQLAVHKPNRRWAIQWDGTQEQIRAHFTPRLIELFNIRTIQDKNGPILTAKTEITTMFARPGYWLLLSYWPRLKRWELYCNKKAIFEDDYDLLGETLDIWEHVDADADFMEVMRQKQHEVNDAKD